MRWKGAAKNAKARNTDEKPTDWAEPLDSFEVW